MTEERRTPLLEEVTEIFALGAREIFEADPPVPPLLAVFDAKFVGMGFTPTGNQHPTDAIPDVIASVATLFPVVYVITVIEAWFKAVTEESTDFERGKLEKLEAQGDVNVKTMILTCGCNMTNGDRYRVEAVPVLDDVGQIHWELFSGNVIQGGLMDRIKAAWVYGSTQDVPEELMNLYGQREVIAAALVATGLAVEGVLLD